MKTIQKIWWLFPLMSVGITQNILPLAQRYFHQQDLGYDYQRGTYLIVLADSSLKSVLTESSTGDYIGFKQSQGYDVKVIDYTWVGGTPTKLRKYLKILDAKLIRCCLNFQQLIQAHHFLLAMFCGEIFIHLILP